MVAWFTRKREAVETALPVAEETDPLLTLLSSTHLPVIEVDEKLGVVPVGVRATADDRTLVVVVEQVHPPRAHDRALAFGLAGVRGRRLAILLPAGDDDVVLATRSRAALLRNVPIDLYTYDDVRAVVHPPLSERMLRSGAGESDGLERAEEYRVPARLAGTAAPIEAWANHELDLTPQHLKSARSWVCEGQRVLSLRATRGGLRVVAGVRDDSLPDPEPLTLTLTGTTSAAQVDAIIVRVEAAIARRRAERAPGYREYRIAATLERVGRATDWDEGPVGRQVRGLRPGGGHARVPFVRVDAAGRLHVVEVAHHRTGLLGIRALDAWIWATENRAALADHLGVPSFSSVVLDVVVAVGPGTAEPSAGAPGAPDAGRTAGAASDAGRSPVGAGPGGARDVSAAASPDLVADDDAEDADADSDDADDEDLDDSSQAAVPAPVLAQLGALSPTVVWEAHELSAWDTDHPVLRTTVRAGVPVFAERAPLMPASLSAVQEFLQLIGPGSDAPAGHPVDAPAHPVPAATSAPGATPAAPSVTVPPARQVPERAAKAARTPSIPVSATPAVPAAASPAPASAGPSDPLPSDPPRSDAPSSDPVAPGPVPTGASATMAR